MTISKLLLRTVGAVEAIPWGYGLAYWRWERDEGVFYLIPFNLIVRLARIVYFRIAGGLFKIRFERKILEALNASRQKGWEIGNKYGFQQGYQKGFADGRKTLERR